MCLFRANPLPFFQKQNHLLPMHIKQTSLQCSIAACPQVACVLFLLREDEYGASLSQDQDGWYPIVFHSFLLSAITPLYPLPILLWPCRCCGNPCICSVAQALQGLHI